MSSEKQHIDLIFRFLNQSAKDTELDKLKTWLEESDDNKRTFDHYNELWQRTQVQLNTNTFGVDKNWNHIQERLGGLNDRKMKKLVPIKRLYWSWAAAIVAVVLASALSLIIVNHQTGGIQQHGSIGTHVEQKTKVYFQDGSSVWLNAGSHVSYTYSEQVRLVKLKGEGYFHVIKNEDIPFVVKVEDVEVKVHGTKFNINAYDDNKFIRTTLEEGSISIKTNKEEKFLKPGQKAVYNKDSKVMVIESDDWVKAYSKWKECPLKFNNASFKRVIKKLEGRYGVKISADAKLLKSARFTMTIKDESLIEVLEMMRLTTSFEYTVKHNTVNIRMK